MVDFLSFRTVNIFNVKLDDEREDHHDDHDPKAKKEKKYSNPAAEFIDKAREKLKITVKEFKF